MTSPQMSDLGELSGMSLPKFATNASSKERRIRKVKDFGRVTELFIQSIVSTTVGLKEWTKASQTQKFAKNLT